MMVLGFLVLVWKSIYLLLPGLFANMAPVFFKKMDFLDYPVDFGRRWKGKQLFGPHKTFRGFFFGILFAIVIAYIQKVLFEHSSYFKGISFIDYSTYNFILIGFLMGFGVLFGDLVESFIKRRISIGPGKPWIPWDQLDFVIGALVFLAIVYIPPWQVIVTLLIAVPLLHITVNHLGYYLRINKSKW